MCCEKNRDFLCAKADYKAMVNMSEHTPQRLTAVKVKFIFNGNLTWVAFQYLHTDVNVDMCHNASLGTSNLYIAYTGVPL